MAYTRSADLQFMLYVMVYCALPGPVNVLVFSMYGHMAHFLLSHGDDRRMFPCVVDFFLVYVLLNFDAMSLPFLQATIGGCGNACLHRSSVEDM